MHIYSGEVLADQWMGMFSPHIQGDILAERLSLLDAGDFTFCHQITTITLVSCQ